MIVYVVMASCSDFSYNVIAFKSQKRAKSRLKAVAKAANNVADTSWYEKEEKKAADKAWAELIELDPFIRRGDELPNYVIEAMDLRS